MLDSDFSQLFVARAVPLSRLISKADRFTIERHGRTAWESKRLQPPNPGC
jgi:hypothetical protein